MFKDGIVLGADTRATANFIADKNTEKIHYIAPNMYCCGAGKKRLIKKNYNISFN